MNHNRKLKHCKGCYHWVVVVRHHLETGKIDISRQYCDSEETMCAGCAPRYPLLNDEERKERQEQMDKYYKRKYK